MESCRLAAEKMQSIIHAEGMWDCISTGNWRVGGDAPGTSNSVRM